MTWPAWLVLMAAVLRVNGIDWSFDPPRSGSPKRSTAGSTPTRVHGKGMAILPCER